MSTPRFKKHKSWIGKDLTIHIGGGDRKIKDHDVLEGSQWAKFVGMGFLTQIADSAEAPKPAASVAVLASPPADPPSVKSEGSVTKSSAGKVSMGEAKGGKGGGKGKGHHVEKEPEAKVETEVKTETETDEPKTDEPPADSEPKTDETKSE